MTRLPKSLHAEPAQMRASNYWSRAVKSTCSDLVWSSPVCTQALCSCLSKAERPSFRCGSISPLNPASVEGFGFTHPPAYQARTSHAEALDHGSRCHSTSQQESLGPTWKQCVLSAPGDSNPAERCDTGDECQQELFSMRRR